MIEQRLRQWHPTPVLLAVKSHGRRSLVGYSPQDREESDTTKQLHFTFHFHALEKEMATHSSVLAWRIPGTGEPGGLPSMGSHRVGHDWSNLAAAAEQRLPFFLSALLRLTLRSQLHVITETEVWCRSSSLQPPTGIVNSDFFFFFFSFFQKLIQKPDHRKKGSRYVSSFIWGC